MYSTKFYYKKYKYILSLNSLFRANSTHPHTKRPNYHDWLEQEKLETKMILQVHDELVFDAPKDEVAHITPHIKRLMADALPMQVPLEVEVGTGTNWLEAH